MIEIPWVSLREVSRMYGLTYESAKNNIHAGTFPVPTYKVGKTWVIDKVVHQTYFTHMREVGLAALKSTIG